MARTKLLGQAISELEKLPADEQNAIAARLLDEIRDERLWAAKFEDTTNEQWDQLAASVRREISAGEFTTLDEFLEEMTSDQ